MSWLVAVLVALGILTVFNTVLCFGVIGRLRAAGSAPAPVPDLDAPAVGTTIGRFVTVTADGEPLAAADVATSVTAFLSPGCGPCEDAARALAALDEAPAEPVFVFVLGDPDDDGAARFAAALPSWARCSFVHDGDAVTAAFGGVGAYPTLLRLADGIVTVHGVEVHDVLPSPATNRR